MFSAGKEELYKEKEEKIDDDLSVPDDVDEVDEDEVDNSVEDNADDITNDQQCEDDTTTTKSNYPEWSWDSVRTYVSIRRSDKYSDDQIKALAANDIVMLEKTTGVDVYGSVEKGTLEAAKRIKAVNGKCKILFYLNAMVREE